MVDGFRGENREVKRVIWSNLEGYIFLHCLLFPSILRLDCGISVTFVLLMSFQPLLRLHVLRDFWLSVLFSIFQC